MVREPASATSTSRYRITGMDCASCASKIEGAVRKLPGVAEVTVSIASQIMTLKVHDGGRSLPLVEETVRGLGYRLARADAGPEGDGDEVKLMHVTPAYRRAIWIVVLLNLGYGLAEIVAGFISGSQALKADALDLLGDGSITFLALLSIGWDIRWRARSALLQGLFLGALGIAVLMNAAYRAVVLNQPEADLMGIFGFLALLVNFASAAALLPHRTGDANVRAVWLFSRNDAIGNVAVVIAAGLVWWTGTPWPDVVVAAAIAGLFLHSAWAIVCDARQDLGTP